MATVLVVDDDRAIRHLVGSAFSNSEHQVLTADGVEKALRLIRDKAPDVVLLDIELPEITGFEAYDQIKSLDGKLPVIYITGGGTSDTAIEAMKLGAFDYLLKPLNLEHVRELTERAIQIRRLMTIPVALSSAVSPEDHGDQMVGRGTAMQEVFKAIGRVAPQDVTVLVRGESGTGKELVARAIYQHSHRRNGPFLAVNCAAIPEQLLETELFGHEKGAFTGADRHRIGKFEQCNGGTLFLDEVGDMPLLLQSKILRVVQQQEFQRVGGNESISVDVRLVAATNRNLEQMVLDGQFRDDLLYRINGYSIHLPPLRDRGDDLAILIKHFVARISRELHRETDGITSEAFELLKSYPWPGNVRELEGSIRQTLLQANGRVVAAMFLPAAIIGYTPHKSDTGVTLPSQNVKTDVGCGNDLGKFIQQRIDAASSEVYAETLEMMEKCLLRLVLTRASGNQSEAARMLGITRGSLRHKIRERGISIESKIEADT